MLKELLPRSYARFLSLPVLGSQIEGFAHYIAKQGYSRGPIIRHIRTARQVDCLLQKGGFLSCSAITRIGLQACGPMPGRSQDDELLASTIRLLERYFCEIGILPPCEPSIIEKQFSDYCDYLRNIRGMTSSTIHSHFITVTQFVEHLCGRRPNIWPRLSCLKVRDIEKFMTKGGKRVSRGTLQHMAAHLRSLLMFLAAKGKVPQGLDTQIDTPRLYRNEQLPKYLPWDTVQSLLALIDRSTPKGLRDYAMFLLIATYGMRASDVVKLQFDDIEWSNNQLRISQRKTNAPLLLPLTDSVGNSIIAYLRDGRPDFPLRQIFVRHRNPSGILKPTAVIEAFQAWSHKSGLNIPYQGAHCLRHSYALHLLRRQIPLKTIGDILGHRSIESTCVYLRLSVEDLRNVALDLPTPVSQEVRHE